MTEVRALDAAKRVVAAQELVHELGLMNIAVSGERRLEIGARYRLAQEELDRARMAEREAFDAYFASRKATPGTPAGNVPTPEAAG